MKNDHHCLLPFIGYAACLFKGELLVASPFQNMGFDAPSSTP